MRVEALDICGHFLGVYQREKVCLAALGLLVLGGKGDTWKPISTLLQEHV